MEEEEDVVVVVVVFLEAGSLGKKRTESSVARESCAADPGELDGSTRGWVRRSAAAMDVKVAVHGSPGQGWSRARSCTAQTSSTHTSMAAALTYSRYK